jgi:hypothetical protein
MNNIEKANAEIKRGQPHEAFPLILSRTEDYELLLSVLR